MPSRNLQFFGTKEEALEVIAEVAQSLELHLTIFREKPYAEFSPSTAASLKKTAIAFDATKVYLSVSSIDFTRMNQAEYSRSCLECVEVILPQLKNGRLFLGDLGVKSDYYDPLTKKVLQMPHVLTLFKKVAVRFKAALSFPVFAWNKNIGKVVEYSDLGYLASARIAVESGVVLAQEGVPNVVFSVDRPA